MGGAVKAGIGFIVALWLICGLVGAWWMDDLDTDHWKDVAKGPITLAAAYNEDPPEYPGPS
jgi:hypothetical protein